MPTKDKDINPDYILCIEIYFYFIASLQECKSFLHIFVQYIVLCARRHARSGNQQIADVVAMQCVVHNQNPEAPITGKDAGKGDGDQRP